MPHLTFAVPGAPMGWSRPENVRGTKKRRNKPEMNARQEAIRFFVTNTIQLSKEFKTSDFPLPIDTPIVLTVQAFFKIADKRKWGKIRLAAPDMSNLIKLVEDALQCSSQRRWSWGIYRDDCQIEKYGADIGRWYSDEDKTIVKLEWEEANR